MKSEIRFFGLNRKTVIIAIVVLFLTFSKFWIGIYTNDEFGDKNIFIKHRPIWHTYFYSPRGMSDFKTSEMNAEQRNEQKLFDEFVLQNQAIE